MTGSHNRGGMYFRSRTIPVNPNTIRQQTVRNAMKLLVVRWNDVLNVFQRSGWNLYAFNVPLTGPLGDPVNVSGFNMFLRTNIHRVQNGRTLLDIAPAIFNLGILSPTGITNASEATQTIDLTFDATDDWNAPAGYLSLYFGRPVNINLTYYKGPYRLAGLADGGLPAVSPVTLPSPFPIIAGQRLFCRTIAMHPLGRLTSPQFLGPLTVAA